MCLHFKTEDKGVVSPKHHLSDTAKVCCQLSEDTEAKVVSRRQRCSSKFPLAFHKSFAICSGQDS